MAEPGTEVIELEDPTIGFGEGGDKEKYGAYAYSLDFNLTLIDRLLVKIENMTLPSSRMIYRRLE